MDANTYLVFSSSMSSMSIFQYSPPHKTLYITRFQTHKYIITTIGLSEANINCDPLRLRVKIMASWSACNLKGKVGRSFELKRGRV